MMDDCYKLYDSGGGASEMSDADLLSVDTEMATVETRSCPSFRQEGWDYAGATGRERSSSEAHRVDPEVGPRQESSLSLDSYEAFRGLRNDRRLDPGTWMGF
eukprot:CAMPEP_0119119522 /NCGR_PEP_ID=MMETSP1310-20130426/977_1 /TAXON_ID=464262 /ORGANISM="Genus nov. species nov., Strain RCC2339" /LENGTH=101 /DNA_ID=CAMNT_0007108963 /DNA_START=108 /DNA_END=410 /DNA_ORIENTATION=-